MRGYFAIGIENTKTPSNIGCLWRSAYLLGASYIFTINHRYKKQASDTVKAYRKIPLFNYRSFDEFYDNIPYDCRLVGVEMMEKSHNIINYIHPERCVYLLGAEDHGLTNKAIDKCHSFLKIPSKVSFNVANAGAIIMYDRFYKNNV